MKNGSSLANEGFIIHNLVQDILTDNPQAITVLVIYAVFLKDVAIDLIRAGEAILM